MVINKVKVTDLKCIGCDQEPARYSIYLRPGQDTWYICDNCMLLLSEAIYQMVVMQKDSYDTTQVAGR